MKSVLEYDGKNIFDFLKGEILYENSEQNNIIEYMDKITNANKNKYTVVLFHKTNHDVYHKILFPEINKNFYDNCDNNIIPNNGDFFTDRYSVKYLRYFLNKNSEDKFFLNLDSIRKDINNIDRIIKNENLTTKQTYDFFESIELYCFLKYLNPILNSTDREPHPFVFNFNVAFYSFTHKKGFIKNNRMYFRFDSKDKALHFANFFRNFSKFFYVANMIFPPTDYLDNNILEKLNNRKYNIKVINRVQYNYKISINNIKAKNNNIDVKLILEQLCKNNNIETKYYKTYSGINYKDYNSVTIWFNDVDILTYLMMVFNNYIKEITLYVSKNKYF